MYPTSLVHLKKKERKKGKEKKVSISVLHNTYAQSFLDFSDPFLYARPCRILYLLLPTGFFQHFTHVQFSPYKQSRTTLSPPSCLPFYLPVLSSLSLAKLLENLVYTSCLRISISQPLFKPLQLGFSHLFTETLSTRSSVTSLLLNLWAPFNCLFNWPSFSSFLKFIYLFIFGCVGSSFLCEGFLQLQRAGATLHHGAWASHCRGLSCCGAQAPDAQAQ